MKKGKFFFINILFFCVYFELMSQTGPGGVGNSTVNKLWLSADKNLIFNYQVQTGTLSITTGSSIINGSGTNFSTSDIGKQIQIVTSNGVVNRIITSVNSNTQIVVNQNMNTTESDCSYSYAYVSSWNDNSGNSNNAIQNTVNYQPLYYSNILNNQPIIYFDGTDDFMTIPSTTWGTNFSIFVVLTPKAALDAHNRILETSYSSHFYLGSGNNETIDCYKFIVNNSSANGAKAGTLVNNQTDIVTAIYNGTQDILYENEGTPGTYTQSSPTNSNFSLVIGKYAAGAGYLYKGNIAEIILYNYAVNSAQRKIINNYLSSKYNVSISNDLYSYDGVHLYDVAGIGRETDGSNTSATSANILNISNPSSLDIGDYILFGHDNGNVSTWTSTESHDPLALRLAREWRVDITNSPGNVTITFNVSNLLPISSNNYYLLIDSDGNFSSGAIAIQLTETGVNTFSANNVNLNDGDFITLAAYPCSTIAGVVSTTDTLIYSGETMNLVVSGYTPGAELQWQQSNGGSFNDISGANSSTYTTPPLISGNTYYFRCKVSYGGCVVYTNYVSPVFKSCLSCAEIGGTGDLNTTCTINTTTTIPNNRYVYGTGNLIIPSGKSLNTLAGNKFYIDLGGNVTIESGGAINGNVDVKCKNLTIAGSINATGKGYLKDSGPGKGKTTNSSSQGAGGGGHGGRGGYGQFYSNSGGDAYGSISNPVTFGSGGGSQTYSGSDGEGGSGGGAIKCQVSEILNITGLISANGTDGEDGGTFLRAAGGGAGGSIWLITSTLTGNGTITANGGNGGASSYDGGGGGGGRIAIFYSNNSFTGTISAKGGDGSNNTSETGGAGTIFIKSATTNAILICDNNSNPNNLVAFTPIDISNNITFKSITARRKSIIEFVGSTQNIVISDTLKNETNGKILFNSIINSFNAPVINVSDSLCFYNPNVFTLNCNSLATTGFVKFYSKLFTLNSLGDISFNNGTNFTAVGYEKRASLSSTNFFLSNGAQINLKGNGYGPEMGPGRGFTSNSSVHGSGGGGFGGRGGAGGNDGIRFVEGGYCYGLRSDSLINPFECGSGGGNNNAGAVKGGAGGGAIKINTTGNCTINGIIDVSGNNGSYSGTYVAGGGAGGSINIITNTLSGNGSLKAIGGSTNNSDGRQRAGSGSGGRIALRYNTSSFIGDILFHAGGKSPNTSIPDYWEIYNAGASGTLFIKKANNNGNLHINNNNIYHIPMANQSENYAFTDNQTELLINSSLSFDTIFVYNEGNLKFSKNPQYSQIKVIKSFNNGRIIFDTDIAEFSCNELLSNDSIVIFNTGNVNINTNNIEINNELISYCSLFTINVLNDFVINSGGIIRAVGNEKRLVINSKNLKIESGGQINYSGNGYSSGNGPGAGSSNPSGTCYGAGGGGYGGMGGYGNGTEPCPGNEPGMTYGSESQPTDFGSGGGSYMGAKAVWNGGSGGGAIKVVCSNTLTINGSIMANGTNGANGAVNRGPGGGSGGSIWIETQVLNGTGILSANGGNGGKDNNGNYRGGGGGGGRISICGVSVDNFYNNGSGSGTVSVAGGVGNYNPPPSGLGANGTIYAQIDGQACEDILPIELLKISAYCSNMKITLNWTTAYESNNDYFTIQTTSDGLHWQTKAIIDGVGNSFNPIDYTWIDNNPTKGNNIYRLTQTDINGNTKIYDPIVVYCSDKELEIINIYPIPSKQELWLEVYSNYSENVYIKVQNLAGQIVFFDIFQLQQGLNTFKISLNNLSASLYYVRVESSYGTLSNTKLLMIEK